MKKIILVFMVLCLSVSGFSQKVTSKINNVSDEEFEKLLEQIKEKVVDFQAYVGHMAGNKYNHDEKIRDYGKALNLFIGRGEPYPYLNPYNNMEEMHDAVQMAVYPSKYSKKKVQYPMKGYLTKLISNSENPEYRYKKVKIEVSEAVRIDNFYTTGDGRYMATAHYMQRLSNYGKSSDLNRPVYVDNTAKTVTIYIELLKTINVDTGEMENNWIILLGDVDCDDVW